MISAQFETLFAAVNTSPNCLKWLNQHKFCTASLKTIIIYIVQPVPSLNTFHASAQLSLNEHRNLVSCVGSWPFNDGFLVASGDKSGMVVVRCFDKVIQNLLSTVFLQLHSMSVNCMSFITVNGEVYIFSCGDSSIKLTQMLTEDGSLQASTICEIDLGRFVPFQIDSIIVNDKMLLAVALDDCKLNLYLCETSNDFKNVSFLPVFQSEPFDDWIRGISIRNHPTNENTLFIAASSQDTFIQLYRMSAPNTSSPKSEDNSMEKTRILNSSGEVVWQIFTESLLSGHIDKVGIFVVLLRSVIPELSPTRKFTAI